MWRELEEQQKDEKEFDMMIENEGVGEECECGEALAVMAK